VKLGSKVNAKKQFLAMVVLPLCLVGPMHSQDAKQGERQNEKGVAAGIAESSSARSTSMQEIMQGAGFNVSSNGSSRSEFSRQFAGFFEDQKAVVMSPARVRMSDATWLVPLGGIAAGLFGTDRQYSQSLSQNPTALRHYRDVSNAGVAGLVGASAGLFLFSFPTHNDHWRETGLLAGRAALTTLVTVESLKYSLRRERPYQNSGSGQFFHGGDSFPSEHSATAWAIAGVIAHEYSGALPKLLAYGMASAVSFSSVHSRQHFPSDVLIGSTLGYLVAQSVYRRRQDPELGSGSWESPHEFVSQPHMQTPSHMGSPYVPLDSWVYPAIERLAAFGYVKSNSLGIRPWTRLECVRLLNEAEESSPDESAPDEVQEIIHVLADEFRADAARMSSERNIQAQLESVYQQSLAIAGRPLTDGYHFGQTVQNDYGRPFQQGFNMAAGMSGWAVAGPFVFYARGEYQSAAPAAAPSAAVLSFISNADELPPNAPSTPIAASHRLRLLDAYVGMNFTNWQISFGRQSLWWGPSESGTLAFTNNAAPLNMLRLNRVSPFRLPGILGYLGDIKLDLFLGQLSGQEFLNLSDKGVRDLGQYGQNLRPQPFLSGARASFKFTENFEFNLSKTTLYGGPGNPLTPKTLAESALGIHVNGEALGDGRSDIDFAYRIPKLRNWLTLYGEGFTEDELSPIAKPGKSAWQGGLYLARVPKLSRLDLRVEGGTTSPVDFPTCTGCFYHNFQYVNGYTNDGQLMGTWIGRAAQGEAIHSNYWLSATRRIGIELRHRQVDRQFLPQGGSQTDVAVNSDFLLKSGFRFSAALQYENWQIPLLAASRQSNVSAMFQFSWWPQPRLK